MAKIIDFGNGYARLDGYGSEYASLTFPLGLSRVRKFHRLGYLNDEEMAQVLKDMGYCQGNINLIIALDNVDPTLMMKQAYHARTI